MESEGSVVSKSFSLGFADAAPNEWLAGLLC
jgi:hypothetical protein